MRKTLLLFGLVWLSACATAYQEKGVSGGFSETQLSDDLFQISFTGNGFTSSERAADFALLRSADITLENGYRYFVIVETQNSQDLMRFQSPTKVNTTGTSNISGSVSAYGNHGTYSGHGYQNTTTTITGGEIHTISRPKSKNMIKLFKKEPDMPFVFNAQIIKQSIQGKYGID